MSDRILAGTGVTPRGGVGTVVWYRPRSVLSELPADDIDSDGEDEKDEEFDRFETARTAAQAELEAERDRTAARVGEEEAAIFDAHIQFLNDPQIEAGVSSAIAERLPADHAVQRAFDEPIEQFEGMDSRMSERADDLRDVRNRLIRLITGAERIDLATLPEGSIIFAERLTPSDTARLDPDRVAGFATVTGGRTSHAAIFARSLALPAVVGVGAELESVRNGATVVVDGDTGEVVVDPSDGRKAAAADESGVEIIRESVATADGHGIEVAANVGRPTELGRAVARGADGVGLYRTEFLFLNRDEPPSEDEQYEAYTAALDAFPTGRVVIRTLDVGGDKSVPYFELSETKNSFLGERGIRRSLGSDAAYFETQLRALLRAAASDHGDGLAVMFPLVATVDEVERALAVVEEVAAALDADGIDYDYPELGVMVETPAATLVAGELAQRVDFLSLGTNDLAQYVMAASRGDGRVAHLHDPLHPAVLRVIARTVEAAEGADCWVGMCGEMAGNPELTELLIGLGLDELSVSPVAIPDVKANVIATDRTEARSIAEQALSSNTRDDVRTVLGIE